MFQSFFIIPSSPPPRSDGGADEQRERTDIEHAVADDGNPAAHNCSVNWRNASSRLWTCNGVLVCKLCLLAKIGTCAGDVRRVGRRPRRRRDCVAWLETEVCVWDDADDDDGDDTTGFSIKKADTKQNKPQQQTEVKMNKIK